MKRHAAKRRPKHVRLAVAPLLAAGASDVLVEVGHAYTMTWTAGGQRLRVVSFLSSAGGAFEKLWAAIRALFRARHLPVPA